MSTWKVRPEYNLYFVTTTIVEWECIFISEAYLEVIIDSLNYCIRNKGLHLHGFVVMPNHFHGILSADAGRCMSDIMRDFGTYTSRHVSELLTSERRTTLLQRFRAAAQSDGRGNTFKIWKGGFHPIVIYTGRFFLEKLHYIHENPVRKGFVEEATHWRYSSARNYILDDHSLIKVECLCN